MSIKERKAAFDSISSTLAIIRFDIEQHQAINDLSLNIHGENFFRDIFNSIYGANYENLNTTGENADYIDLVDYGSKQLVQVTTTRSKEKIINSLNVFKNPKFIGFKFEIYYLLEKAKPNALTIKEIENKYGFNLSSSLKDSSDLIKDISNLTEPKLLDLYNIYFKGVEKRYSKEVALEIVCKKLVRDMHTLNPRYDDPLSNIDVKSKINLNQLNERIANQISLALDYAPLIHNIDDSETPDILKSLVIEQLFRTILYEHLGQHIQKDKLEVLNTEDLQKLAETFNISFNTLIGKLQERISNLIEMKDFNGINIPWIIVAFYFELCFVGRS